MYTHIQLKPLVVEYFSFQNNFLSQTPQVLSRQEQGMLVGPRHPAPFPLQDELAELCSVQS